MDGLLSGLIGAGTALIGQNMASNAAIESGDQSLAAAKVAAEASRFKPYGVTTGFGSSWFNPQTQQAGYNLDPGMAAWRDAMMMGAGTVADQVNLDPTDATNQYYNQIQDVMQPRRAQEQGALQQNLFGSGRLGMRLAGEGAGAGLGTGMYQPDVLGYNKAQELANQQFAMQARQNAFNEMDQGIGRAQGLFNTGLATEEYGLKPLALGAELGGRSATGGAAYGSALMSGANNAANARLQAGLGWSNTLANTGLGLMQYNQPK